MCREFSGLIYTVSDVIGSLASQIGALSGSTTTTGTGQFTEADETAGITDSANVSAQPNPAWGAGQWNMFVWS